MEALAADEARGRVETCLLLRERTIAALKAWLLSIYKISQALGSKYGGGGGSGLRSWQTVSVSTHESHLIKLAVFIAALRLQTCELIEAIQDWRAARSSRSEPLRAPSNM